MTDKQHKDSSILFKYFGAAFELLRMQLLRMFVKSSYLRNLTSGQKNYELDNEKAIAFSSIHILEFGVYHEARQPSQLFSPDRFHCMGHGGT